MYTLRKITSKKIEFNQNLGESYSVFRKDKNEDAFLKMYVDFFQLEGQENIEFGNCYAFVISEGAKETYPLFKDEQNYIVNNEGKTFSNLTY